MKEKTYKALRTIMAILAFGIGAVNIVNGAMLMHEAYLDNHPRHYRITYIKPEPETKENENNT